MIIWPLLKKFKEKVPSKEKFYRLLKHKQISDKEYEHVLKACNKLEKKIIKDYHDIYLKCDSL